MPRDITRESAVGMWIRGAVRERAEIGEFAPLGKPPDKEKQETTRGWVPRAVLGVSPGVSGDVLASDRCAGRAAPKPDGRRGSSPQTRKDSVSRG